MFYHSKELQFKARVSRPDPRFARLLLEQFGGGNGELKAAMQYFVQAFACHNPYPDKYDMLMDIATEELGHLEIVGATIQMLLAGVNGNLKDAAERNDVFGESISKDDFIHSAFSINPQFGVLTGGGPRLTDSNGVPWQGSYVNANSDLTVDLRSDIAAESRAKIVYEYLMQFTDDKDVLATLNFLMTREVAHFQQFEAALGTIQPTSRRECSRAIPATATSTPIIRRERMPAARGTRAKAPDWAKSGSMSRTRASRCSKPTDSRSSNRREHPAPKLRCAVRTRNSARSAAAKSARRRRRRTSGGASTNRKTPRRPAASRSNRTKYPVGPLGVNAPEFQPERSSCFACALQQNTANIKYIYL